MKLHIESLQEKVEA